MRTIIGCGVLLSGCTTYQPQPVETTRITAARSAARLDPVVVAKRLASLAPAAGWDGRHWDRLALFVAALDGNPGIAVARATLASAITAAKAARVRAGPTLNLASEYSINPPESSPFLFGGTIDFPFEFAGRRQPRLTSADLGIAAARQDLAEAIWSTRLALRRALADRLLADRQRALFDTIIAVRQRQFAVLQRRVAAGAAARADLERARADAADAVRRRADAEVLANTATAALAATLGVPAEALTGIALAWDDFDAPAPAVTLPDRTERAAALASRADVLKAVVSYDLAEADLKGEVAKQYPSISLGPGFTWERGLVKIPFNVALVLPPLDLNRAGIRAAESRRAEAGARLEASVAMAQGEIDRALAAVAEARALLAKVRGAEIPAADRLAVQADRELAAGAIDRGDWAAAAAGAMLARASELDALARVHAADAGLEDALRRPVTGPELLLQPRNDGVPK